MIGSPTPQDLTLVWGAPLLVEGYKKIISKSSWGGHDTSKGGTHLQALVPTSPVPFPYSSGGRVWGGKRIREIGVAIKEGEGHMHQIYIQNWCGDPPPISLGTQVSKPPDHKEKKQTNPQTLVLHTQSSCPPSRSSSAGRPQAPSSLRDPGVVSPAPPPWGQRNTDAHC